MSEHAEAYAEGFEEGRAETSGAAVEIVQAVYEWMRERELLRPECDVEGISAYDVVLGLTEHETALLRQVAR